MKWLQTATEAFNQSNDQYRVQLDVFEGPLDLLYHMVREEKIDIWDIPIAKVTEQYMAYIDALDKLMIDPAADFLVMAARLLQIKARMLLPEEPKEDTDEDEDDPRLSLAIDLYEYALFKEISGELSEYADLRTGLFGRPESAKPSVFGHAYPDPAGGATIAQLAEAFFHVLNARREAPDVPVPRPRVSVSEKITSLRRLFDQKGEMKFRTLFPKEESRPVVIATFLALLELIREGVLACRYEQSTADIVVSRKE